MRVCWLSDGWMDGWMVILRIDQIDIYCQEGKHIGKKWKEYAKVLIPVYLWTKELGGKIQGGTEGIFRIRIQKTVQSSLADAWIGSG